MIDDVLAEGSVDTSGVSMTEVNVRSLGHCHNNDTVATILKTANTLPTGREDCFHAYSANYSQLEIWLAVQEVKPRWPFEVGLHQR